jgi:hypothetical protein
MILFTAAFATTIITFTFHWHWSTWPPLSFTIILRFIGQLELQCGMEFGDVTYRVLTNVLAKLRNVTSTLDESRADVSINGAFNCWANSSPD